MTRPLYDYAIIGCGMAGASLAYELSESGASVLVLESEAYPAFHTTGRSAAFYMEAYGNATVRQITQSSRHFFDSPPNDFTHTPLLKPCGALYLAREQQTKQLQALYTQLKDRIENCQLVSDEFLKNKIPLLKNNIVKQGFWEPQSMEIDVAALLEGYIKLAKRNDSVFHYQEPVTQLHFNKTHWLINDLFQANVIVNAGGAWSDKIAQLAQAQSIALQPKKRTVCIASLANEVDVRNWPLTLDIDEKFYFKPEGNKLLITPADENPVKAHDAQADEYDVALGIARVQEVVDIKIKQVTRKWAGLRTFSKDKSPVVGFDGQASNFFWLAGQGGYGIQMAPALAKLASALLQHKTTNLITKTDITKKISPQRFS